MYNIYKVIFNLFLYDKYISTFKKYSSSHLKLLCKWT